jgi:hypothetical protein
MKLTTRTCVIIRRQVPTIVRKAGMSVVPVTVYDTFINHKQITLDYIPKVIVDTISIEFLSSAQFSVSKMLAQELLKMKGII